MYGYIKGKNCHHMFKTGLLQATNNDCFFTVTDYKPQWYPLSRVQWWYLWPQVTTKIKISAECQ